MSEGENLNPFGEVLRKLMEEKGIDAAELAARLQKMCGAPFTEDDVVALLTAEPGEEFVHVVSVLGDALPHEN